MLTYQNSQSDQEMLKVIILEVSNRTAPYG